MEPLYPNGNLSYNMTQAQVNKKYKGRYVDFSKRYDYEKKCWVYEVHRTYGTIHENTTLGEDVGTNMEYRR